MGLIGFRKQIRKCFIVTLFLINARSICFYISRYKDLCCFMSKSVGVLSHLRRFCCFYAYDVIGELVPPTG